MKYLVTSNERVFFVEFKGERGLYKSFEFLTYDFIEKPASICACYARKRVKLSDLERSAVLDFLEEEKHLAMNLSNSELTVEDFDLDELAFGTEEDYDSLPPGCNPYLYDQG